MKKMNLRLRPSWNRLPVAMILAFLAGLLLLVACGPSRPELAQPEPVGNFGGAPQRGARLIEEYGCGACHSIPGIDGADALVGPPLDAWAQRGTIAGTMPNTPDNLIFWIQNPQEVEPGTVMPDMGVDRPHARDIAAYLYTLER